jgi:DNA-binding IscR family transcriptional regulator
MSDADRLRNELRDAAEMRSLAKQAEQAAFAKIRLVAPKAKAEGVSVTEIAAILGMSRQALYQLVEELREKER